MFIKTIKNRHWWSKLCLGGHGMPKTTLIVTTGFGEAGTEAQLSMDVYSASCGG